MPIHPTRLLLLVFFLLPVCRNAFGQRLRFEQLDVQYGLPANEVYNLFQDNRGYIWAFTEYGIARHNGNSFVPACRNLPFDESIVYTVRRSLHGEMYIANSKAHIYRVKNDSAFLINGLEKGAEQLINNNEVIYDMQVNDSDDIYLSSFLSSYHYYKGKLISPGPGKKKDTAVINMRPTGTGYFTEQLNPHTTNFFVRILDRNNRPLFSSYFYAFPMTGIRAKLLEDKRYYYLQLREQIFRIAKSDHTVDVAPVNEVMSMNISPSGNIWAGTKKGLYELGPGLTVLGHYFETCIVSDILFDNDYGAWVSTIGQGVFYCHNTQHLFYDNIPELSGTISMLKKTRDGLFTGTTRGKLLLITHGQMKTIIIDSNEYEIKDICPFNGGYYVGTKGRVYALDKKLRWQNELEFMWQGKRINSYGFIQHSADSLISISAASVNWITTRNSDNQAITDNHRIGAYHRSILKQGNSYLVGTSKGLAVFTDSLRLPAQYGLLNNISVSRLRMDHEGTTWICTKGGGLYVLRSGGRPEPFGHCPSNVVNDIVFEGKDTFLLCTNKGLYRYCTPSHSDQNVWTRLIASEVLSCELFSGKIFAATKQGLIALNTDTLSYHFKAPIMLASVVCDDSMIAPGNIRLRYNENDLYFNFEVLAYDDPDCSLRFKLEGPGYVKEFSGNNQLHLQNLVPGAYLLYVYALDNAQNISLSSPLKIEFYIKPAFWQTRIFTVLAAIFIVGIMALFMWLSYQRIRQKEHRKTMLIRELAGHKLTALKSQINPHFISNSLTAIQNLVINNEVDRANLYIARFSLLIRYALQYSDKLLTSLTNELRVIEIIIDLEQLRFSNSFIFETEIDKQIDANNLFVPPLITQPIIENAIWHGLLPLKGIRPPKLTLKIAERDEHLFISIIDNGVGRPHRDQYKPARESKGLKLINSWIDNLNKLSLGNHAAIHITDLHDEQQRPNGTRVDIVLNIKALAHLQHDEQ
jgi:hypothetical protein